MSGEVAADLHSFGDRVQALPVLPELAELKRQVVQEPCEVPAVLEGAADRQLPVVPGQAGEDARAPGRQGMAHLGNQLGQSIEVLDRRVRVIHEAVHGTVSSAQTNTMAVTTRRHDGCQPTCSLSPTTSELIGAMGWLAFRERR